MKTLKKLLVMFTCLALLVSVSNFGEAQDDTVQTWGLVDWVFEVE